MVIFDQQYKQGASYQTFKTLMDVKSLIILKIKEYSEMKGRASMMIFIRELYLYFFLHKV